MFEFDTTERDDPFFDVDIRSVLSTDFYDLPDGITLHFPLTDKKECFISVEGNFIVVQIELSLESEREAKGQERDVYDGLMKAIRNLGTQRTMMAEDGIYFNGGMKVLYWSYRELNTIQAHRLYRNVTIDCNYISEIASKFF